MSKTSVLFLVISIAGCGIASADTLDVSVSGQFSSSDTAGPLVSPDGTFNLSFQVDSNPTPEAGSVTVNSFDVPITGFSYTLDGTPISVTPSEITFETLANGGLFNVTFGSGLSAEDFSFEGDQAFSGTTAAPTFSAGSFSVSEWTYSDGNGNYDIETPTSLNAQIAPVPEPSSAFPILGGFLALIAVRFRKFGWAR
ncbi:MAG: hypothetical protein WBE37_09715 [Bryobacteraceae bacterium]